MKVERKRKPHRCSIKPDPEAGWALPMSHWRREFEALSANKGKKNSSKQRSRDV